MTRNQFNQRVTDFFNRWNSQHNNYDDNFGTQCKDLFSQYNKDVVGYGTYIKGDAWALYDAAPDSIYEKIINTKTSVPQRGDIIIWGKSYGGYGHVAIFDSGDVNTMRVFGQNYPVTTKFNPDGSVKSNGSPCQFANMSYSGVYGYLRPRNINDPETVVTPPAPQKEIVYVDREVIKYVDKPVIEYRDRTETLEELEGAKAELERLKSEIAASNITKDEYYKKFTEERKAKTEYMAQVGELSKPLTDEQKKAIAIEYIKNLIGRIFSRR